MLIEFDEAIQAVKDLKIKAKNRREVGKYELAVKILSEAINILAKYRDENAPLSEMKEQEINSQLADCYGIMGGVFRRWGLSREANERQDLLKSSKENYEAGFEFEKKGAKPNSYNLVNRLIAKILFEPSILTEQDEQFSQELKDAEQKLEEQLRVDRAGDVWALADEGTLKLLEKKSDPARAFSAFVGRSPDAFAYKSLVETLTPLSNLDIPQSESIRKAISFLEAKKPA